MKKSFITSGPDIIFTAPQTNVAYYMESFLKLPDEQYIGALAIKRLLDLRLKVPVNNISVMSEREGERKEEWDSLKGPIPTQICPKNEANFIMPIDQI